MTSEPTPSRDQNPQGTIPGNRHPLDDQRVQDVVTLLGNAPIQPNDRILDVGVGNGAITRFLASRGGLTVGTGLHLSTYFPGAGAAASLPCRPVECLVENLPFGADTFNVVVLSHVLEHCPNPGLALQEVWRVLRPGGLLCVLVPPSEDQVRGGHVSVGWNIGQLLYVLALHRFDTAQGHYARLRYNVCAMVRKTLRPLPSLRHDFGDLTALNKDGWFPSPLDNPDRQAEAFFGDLRALNWPWVGILEPRPEAYEPGPRTRFLRRLVPGRWRPRLVGILNRALRAWADTPAPARETINPKSLRM